MKCWIYKDTVDQNTLVCACLDFYSILTWAGHIAEHHAESKPSFWECDSDAVETNREQKSAPTRKQLWQPHASANTHTHRHVQTHKTCSDTQDDSRSCDPMTSRQIYNSCSQTIHHRVCLTESFTNDSLGIIVVMYSSLNRFQMTHLFDVFTQRDSQASFFVMKHLTGH